MNPDIFVDPSSVGMWTVSTYTKNKMKMNRKENLIGRFDVPRAFELLKDRLLSICTFHELPSSTILRPKCLLHEICWVNSHPLGKEAFTHCLFVGQFNLTWLSSVFICSALFHGPLLCCVFSIFLCSRLERGSTRTNQLEKALCPPASENTLALFPPFVCLPPTYTQYEHESFPCLQLSTMLHLCAPAHTPEYHNRTPWTSASGLCLTPLFFICHFLINTVCLTLSVSILFSLHVSNWWPHPTPTSLWLHQAAAAVKATEQSVGGGDN